MTAGTDAPPPPPVPPRPRTILPLRVVLPTASVIVAGGCLAALFGSPGAGAAGPSASSSASDPASTGPVSGRDLDGRPVRVDPGASPLPAASAEASIGVRLRVPSVGLDVPVGAVSAVDGVVVPPGFRSAYWVRDRGRPVEDAERGTVVLVMHALGGGGRAPGNAIVRQDGTVRVRAGDEVRVGDHRYRVEASRTVRKSGLAADALWSDEPGRLLVVTCLPSPDGSAATRNVVVAARLVPDGS
ncbi:MULTISPECIES: class F sortase [unclassified Curtobacterium]|uniref:class F sortase n=1 Tax=unclassified Curtobacterium TaxID=257496 RepID=UPI0021ACF408|nr:MULTISPECIES: class F sortase [unclassified Curtobacterium]